MVGEQGTLAKLVGQYGYMTVFLGTALEGETVVLAAGFFAHHGLLSVPLIALCAFLGSSCSDQGLFFLARKKGKPWLVHRPALSARVEALADKAGRHPMGLILFALFFRFLYGLRNIAPIVLGISTLPAGRFVVLNLAGASLWALLFSYGGYYFAGFISMLARSVAFFEFIFFSALALSVLAYCLYRYGRKRWGKH